MISVSYYNKMTIRELRSSIELLSSNIANMSREITNNREHQQKIIESVMNSNRVNNSNPMMVEPQPPQQYYPSDVYTDTRDNRGYYYYGDEGDTMYQPQPQVSKETIGQISRLTTMTDSKNMMGRQPVNNNRRLNSGPTYTPYTQQRGGTNRLY